MEKHILVICPNPAIDILASMPNFQKGLPNRLLEEKRYPGGKGIHVAMALAELGFDVTVVGFWGGASGTWIREEAKRYYPRLTFSGPEVNGWSRSCYTFKTADDFDDTEVLGTGPIVSSEGVNAFYQTVEHLLPNSQAIVMSGSWPAGAPGNGYAVLTKLAHHFQKPTFLDCTGDMLSQALAERPFAVHLNRKEITQHFQLDFESAQHELLKYCQLSAVTDGSRGLYLSTIGRTTHALCRIENVISTIGSGDCLLAGIVAGHLQEFPLEEIARLGAACGAANCLRAELGMLYAADVSMLRTKAEVNNQNHEERTNTAL